MNRRELLSSLGILLTYGKFAGAKGVVRMKTTPEAGKKMPALFVGHGSPMNAVEENEFVNGFRTVAKELGAPEAIVCISAHWETEGTAVTAAKTLETIHDFGGFPRELYEIRYPAPGRPELAKEIAERDKETKIALDNKWGLDHGCWVPLMRMYPDAKIPVVQVSLDYSRDARWHYEFAKRLAWLRERGVLIVGSGNIVHNLGLVAWDKMNEIGFGYDWAIEANEKMKKFIIAGDHASLIDYHSQGRAFNLAIPTPEHFLPLLYILALQREGEPVKFFNDKPVAGSLAMTSVKIG
jgi:4,5-DOPA dioxygenase extradiol